MDIVWEMFTRNSHWLIVLLVLGCGDPDRTSVSGKVTLDGQPVERGTISFIPTHGHPAPNAWGEIVKGVYSIEHRNGPAPGNNRVEIHWPRKTGRKSPYAPDIDEYSEAVPDRYHRDSELRIDLVCIATITSPA